MTMTLESEALSEILPSEFAADTHFQEAFLHPVVWKSVLI